MANIRNPSDIDSRVLSDDQLYHEVGDRVQLLSTGEVGVVVRTWYNDVLQCQDCYVVFDDGGHRDAPVDSGTPHILRYLASSLFPLGDEEQPLDPWWELDFEVSAGRDPHPASVYEGYDEWRETGVRPQRTEKASGIVVYKTERHVVEYEDIVGFLLDQYDEIGGLPETKRDCEDLIRTLVQDEFGYVVTGEHDKRADVEELVQGFYTDFEERKW